MNFKIATWNVNSLRVRLGHLLEWLAIAQPDIVALQEIKLEDKDFPLAAISQAGYQTVYAGQKTYNGVALLSKLPIVEPITDIPDLIDAQRRILVATINNVRIINLYVPNGASVDSDKYKYKLAWLEKVTVYIESQLQCYEKLIVLGDFNIAPDDRDVYEPAAWVGQVLVSPAERAALQKMMALGLTDSFRLFTEEAKHFSWWDYRQAAFRRNLGMRIDHIMLSKGLTKHCTSCMIDKLPRQWERPSDHTPVIASFLLE